jgi:phenylalanyl-tRNA synthetase beta chain
MRIIPAWLREFVNVPADDRQLAEDLTSAGIAVESVEEENGATFYEMDLTTNRVDAMNHYGVAREASAIYDVELKNVEPMLPKEAGPSTAPTNGRSAPLRVTKEDARKTSTPPVGMTSSKEASFPIVIDDATGCARYTARVVRNVKIGASPERIVKRLELLGSRSINNAADATNYALNELGHPTHAFDLDRLEGGVIIVRRARAGEVLTTLDGVERKLSLADLVIADAEKPVALAGVMGGFDTMITEQTKNVFIESAWFDPATIRSMAKRHGMHTDASHRFERGADYGITPLACDRVAELILESAGGELQGELIDAVARELKRTSIMLRSSEVKRHLGIDIGPSEIGRILPKLGFSVAAAKTENDLTGKIGGSNLTGKTISPIPHVPSVHVLDSPDPAVTASEVAAAAAEDTPAREASSTVFSVQVPTWRLDVEREIDLLEELARIYGYNKFPNTLPAFTGAVVALPDEAKNAKVRDTMLALGYDEAISITFISEHEAKTFGGGEPLALANPLSEEAGYMRTSLLPGLLNMVAYNLNRGTASVRLFEAGEVFEKLGERHAERRHLGFVATGDALTKSVHAGAQPYTFFNMKADIEGLLAAFQYKTLYFDAMVPDYFHPGRSARAVLDGETVARFGQLHPEQAAARKLRQDVYIAEVMLDRLYHHSLREPRYQRISKFPAVERDFSFVFDDAVTFEKIKSAVEELQIAEMTAFVPAEIYRGEKVGSGKYSVLLHAEFQSKERTLRDDEVAHWSAQMIGRLEALGGTLRAQ